MAVLERRTTRQRSGRAASFAVEPGGFWHSVQLLHYAIRKYM